VSGAVDGFLGNARLAALLEEDADLDAGVRGIIDTLDRALGEDDMAWLAAAVTRATRHEAMYSVLGAMEQLLHPGRVAWLGEPGSRQGPPGGGEGKAVSERQRPRHRRSRAL
jgi:hypothetical protein